MHEIDDDMQTFGDYVYCAYLKQPSDAAIVLQDEQDHLAVQNMAGVPAEKKTVLGNLGSRTQVTVARDP